MKQNLCFETECTILEYRSCENHFPPNASILIPCTNNGVCECFGAVWKPSKYKMKQNLCFGPECTISGYRSCENYIPPNASILIPRTNNGVCECFGAFSNPSKCRMKQNLCFGSECTILGYRSCKNYFPPNASILIPHTNNGVCECLG
jgi:hypothetical protein